MKKSEQFLEDLQEWGISLSEKQWEQFFTYYELLLEWNAFINLTTITEFEEVMKKHFLDSLSLLHAMDLNQELTLIDMGTGAGFPGIPLKILFPQLQITLLDSLNKRVKFLNEVIEKLALENIQAVHGRAEDFAKPGLLREKFDICVSRAVANMTTLSEYCLPFVKQGGKFVSYKSEKAAEEIQSAKHAISILGGKAGGSVEFYLPSSDIYRVLLIVDKVKITPLKYPRKAGLPGKEPLGE